MTESPLYAALAMLQKDPPTLTKNKDGQAGNHKTKYADLVQVNTQVLAKLNELGLVWVCAPTLRDERTFVLRYELRHVASGEALMGEYPLKLSENSQQMGSAITYARRYALLAVTGIAAEEEDDDGRGADGRGAAQRAAKRATPEQQQQTAQRRPTGPPLPNENAMGRAQGKMFALFKERGVTGKDAMLAFIADAIKREVASRNDLSGPELSKVIAALELLPIVAPEIDDEQPGGAA